MSTKNYESITQEQLLQELHDKKKKLSENLKQIAKLEEQMTQEPTQK